MADDSQLVALAIHTLAAKIPDEDDLMGVLREIATSVNSVDERLYSIDEHLDEIARALERIASTDSD